MDLFRKVRTLLGALVHRPFAPQPEKVDVRQQVAASPEEAAQRERPELEAQQPQVTDTGRVADLIAQRQRQRPD